LERRHILETHESHIDPSLADKYRMLEKAILLDQLNSKISHRPGPLELIEKNILHAEEPIERIVKEGLLFKTEPESSTNFVQFEDDSQSSEGDQQQQQKLFASNNQQLFASNNQQLIEISAEDSQFPGPTRNVLETAAASAGIINISVAVPKHELNMPMTTVNFQVPSSYRSEIPPPPPPPIKTEKPQTITTYHIKSIVPKQLDKSTPQPPALVKSNSTNLLQLIPDIGSPVSTSSLSPASSIASPSPITVISKPNISTIIQNNQKYSAPGKDKNRKKAKSKPVSKMRTIKFHEYKGPPNAQKNSSCNNLSANPVASTSSANNNRKNAETNYELILQQQCLLEYLEGIYKHPPLLSGNSLKNSGDVSLSSSCSNSIICDSPSSTADSNNNSESSGFVDGPSSSNINTIVEKPIITTTTKTVKPMPVITQQLPQPQQQQQITIFPTPPIPAVQLQSPTTGISSDLAKLNKMKVSDLKAHLKRLNLPVSGPKPQLIERLKPFMPLDNTDGEETISSSNSQEIGSVSSESDHDFMDVQQIDSPPSYSSVVTSTNSSKEDDIVREQQRKIEELQRKLIESQQQLEQMKQHTVVAPDVKPDTEIKKEPITFIPTNSNVIYDNAQFKLTNPMPTVFVVDMPQEKIPPVPPLIETGKKLENSGKFFLQMKSSQNSPKMQRMEDPPGYEEAAAAVNSKKLHNKEKEHDKEKALSQEITDVLEILIQNGELPESAVEPQTDFSHLMINPNAMFDTNVEPVLNPVSSTSDLLIDYNIMSPMQEDPPQISSTDKTMDKLLGQVQNNIPSVSPMSQPQMMSETPSSSSNLCNPSAILPDFNDIGLSLEFPMDIEDESNPLSPIHVNNYENSSSNNNNTKISSNFRLDTTTKTPNTKSDNCDNNLSNLFNNTSSNNSFDNSTKNNILKNTGFGMDHLHHLNHHQVQIQQQQHHHHHHPKTNDLLISNFNHGLDSFSGNNNFTNGFNENQMMRFNNAHLNNNCNNNNNNESTPMDFEHMFDLHENINGQDNFNHINPFDNTLFNDIDFRMANVECEVDNLLCN
jgi:hypothetical protein